MLQTVDEGHEGEEEAEGIDRRAEEGKHVCNKQVCAHEDGEGHAEGECHYPRPSTHTAATHRSTQVGERGAVELGNEVLAVERRSDQVVKIRFVHVASGI